MTAADPRPDGDRPPLPPEVVAEDKAYMLGMVRGREIEREAGVADPRVAEPQWLSQAAEVAVEGERAKAMHGEPADRPGRDWLAILAEEFGEVAMEVTKGEVPPVNRDRTLYLTNLRGELVQVASVAMRWLAATDRALSDTDTATSGGVG